MSTEGGLDLDELRASIREVLDAESTSQAVRRAADGDASGRQAIWTRMAGLGWLGLAVDEAHGGLGLGFSELAVLYEETGRRLTPGPLMGTLMAAELIGRAGSAEQQDRWLPGIASGALTAAVVLPQAAGLALDAEGVDLVLAPHGGGFAVLDLADVQLTSRPILDRTRALSQVTVTGQVRDERLLRPSKSVMADLFAHACLALACDAVGGAGASLDGTVEYLKTRVQFDRPIGSFQALKHRAATWKILLEAAIALVGQGVQMLAVGDPERAVWASNAKFYACDAFAEIAGDAIQLHGGIGFTWEHDCHLYLKRAKLSQTLLGGAAEHKDRVARAIFADT